MQYNDLTDTVFQRMDMYMLCVLLAGHQSRELIHSDQFTRDSVGHGWVMRRTQTCAFIIYTFISVTPPNNKTKTAWIPKFNHYELIMIHCLA